MLMKISIRDLLLVSMVLVFFCPTGTSQVRYFDKSLPSVEKNFNLQVHMTVDSINKSPLLSFEQVEEILQLANHYFEPIGMSFSACDYNVIEKNYAYSDLKEMIRVKEIGVVYSLPRRINVFFVNSIIEDKCGFSYFNGFATDRNAQIFIELACGDGPAEQLAHHMGILLGLTETNRGEVMELVDGSNCAVAGDSICDTPADPFGMVRDSFNVWVRNTTIPNDSLRYFLGCEFVWEELDDNGEFFTPHTSNIMSPYPCKCEFTREQYLKMVFNYNKSPIKQY